MALNEIVLQKAIYDAGFHWIARTPPETEAHGLGRLAPDAVKVKAAVDIAQVMLEARIRLAPITEPRGRNGSPQTGLRPEIAATTMSPAAAAASLPSEMD